MSMTRPQLLYAASSIPMAALTAFAAWLFFFVPGGVAGVQAGHYLVLSALIAYPVTLAMQVWATMGLYRQARTGLGDEPTARTRGLIGLSFLSLAGPVLVFLGYAIMRR